MGDNHMCKVQGMGNVKVKMHDGCIRVLSNVRHVPELKKNLVSLGYLERNGYGFSSHPGTGVLKICKGQMVVMKGVRLSNNLYKMQGTVVIEKEMAQAVSSNSKHLWYKIWHARMGHMSDQGLEELASQGLVPRLRKEGRDLCEPCVLGKQTRVSFHDSVTGGTKPLDLIHTDVWGPAPTTSRNGAKYYVSFIDDATRKTWLYLMKDKSEMFSKFKLWKAEVERV